MARAQNVKNLRTEKIGITILKNKLNNFIVPTKEERNHTQTTHKPVFYSALSSVISV